MNTPPDPKPSSVDLERLKELNNQASPSPWHVEPLSQFVSKRDAELIVAMRHSLPSILALSDELERTQQGNERLKEENARLRHEVLDAKFSPLGDNHHNALKCPHCNPDRIDPKALQAALTQAQSRADAAEGRVEKLCAVLGLDQTFSLASTLEELRTAVDHLFDGHSCDHHGYEVWMQARDKVAHYQKRIHEAVTHAKPTLPSDPATSGVEAEEGKEAQPADREQYIADLFTRWCECSPYGEQIPDKWPELMSEFATKHANKDRDFMAELFSDGDGNEPFEKLLESIFDVACEFVIGDLSNAAYDRDIERLSVIGITKLPAPTPAVRETGTSPL